MDPAPGVPARPEPQRDPGWTAVMDVVAATVDAQSLDEVLDAVARGAARLVGADRAAVAVFGTQRGDVVAMHGGADDGTDARGRALGILDELRGSTALRREGEGSDALLGVPVILDGLGVGALYVAGRPRGTFGEQDERLLSLFARAVATAAANARVHAELRAQRRWLTATAEIGSQLLTVAGEDPLRLVARRAREVSEADLVVIALVTEDQSAIVIEEVLGPDAPDIQGRRYPLGETLAGLSVIERRAILAEAGADFGSFGVNLTTVIDVGPVMVLPLIGTQGVRGSMTVSRTRGRGSFSATDLALAAGFATHASVALELADSRAAEQRVVLLEDRDRIARDLHDHVIQELFAIGLGLQSVATQVGLDTEPGERIGHRVEDLDRTIRRIRTSIFELRGPLGVGQDEGLRQAALDIASDLTPALGVVPTVEFSGPVDAAVGAELTADLVAVIREALTNVAKHAHAGRVSVDVDVRPGEVIITVSDDGIGLRDGGRSSGIANLRARAERRGGRFDVNSAPAGGTLLVWRSPLP